LSGHVIDNLVNNQEPVYIIPSNHIYNKSLRAGVNPKGLQQKIYIPFMVSSISGMRYKKKATRAPDSGIMNMPTMLFK